MGKKTNKKNIYSQKIIEDYTITSTLLNVKINIKTTEIFQTMMVE